MGYHSYAGSNRIDFVSPSSANTFPVFLTHLFNQLIAPWCWRDVGCMMLGDGGSVPTRCFARFSGDTDITSQRGSACRAVGESLRPSPESSPESGRLSLESSRVTSWLANHFRVTELIGHNGQPISLLLCWTIYYYYYYYYYYYQRTRRRTIWRIDALDSFFATIKLDKNEYKTNYINCD